MRQFYSARIIKRALVIVALMATAAVNASPLDCTAPVGAGASGVQCIPDGNIASIDAAPALKEAVPVVSANLASQGFHINQARSPSSMPESVPLMLLITAVIAILLVRAKRFNNK